MEKSFEIKDLLVNDRPVTATTGQIPRIDAAVEFWTRANAGFAGEPRTGGDVGPCHNVERSFSVRGAALRLDLLRAAKEVPLLVP